MENALFKRLTSSAHNACARTLGVTHMGYYAAVAWEAHSFYGWIAAGLFVLTLIGHLLAATLPSASE